MDNNIRLSRFDENGIGYFIEYDLEAIDARTKVKRRIEVPLSNFQKNGYSCRNFSIDRNGKCKFNNTTYANLSDMFNGIPISDRKRINGRDENEVTTLVSIKMMVEAAASAGNAMKIKINSGYVYALVIPNGRNERGEERPADVLIYIPEEVKKAEYYHWFNVNDIFDPNIKYGTVRMVGGGPSLQTIGGIMKGITAEYLDVSMLYKDRLADLGGMFENCCFDTLDISWFNKCKRINNLTDTFRKYRGKVIDLCGFSGERVKTTAGTFAETGAEIRGLERFVGKLEIAADMFKGYCNKDTILDLRNINTTKITNTIRMFQDCTVKAILVDGWDTTKVVETTSMFEGARAEVSGLEATGDSWNLENVIYSKKMFKDARLKKYGSTEKNDFATVRIKNDFGRLSHAEEMFMGATIGLLDISDMKYAGKGCENIFEDMQAKDIIGPDITNISPYTRRLLIELQNFRTRRGMV